MLTRYTCLFDSDMIYRKSFS